jgi:LPXTG-motif cell wall-anchored protein
MKKMKKVLALLLAMTMVFAMSTTAFAAQQLTPDKEITVTDLEVGDDVSYYHFIQWKNGAWAFSDDFAAVLTDADLIEIVGTPEIYDDPTTPDDESQPAVPGKITYEMSQKLAEAANSATADGTDTNITSKTWKKSIADASEAGLYMIIVAAKTSGIIYNPAFVAADFNTKADSTSQTISMNALYPDTAVAKKTIITIPKTESDSNEKVKMAVNSHLGEMIDFEFETTIPVYMPSYKNPYFVITDEIKTKGITLDPSTITVVLSPQSTLSVDDTYKMTPNGTNGFEIAFEEDYLKGNTTSVTVNVKYKGQLTGDTAFNLNREENDVTVSYSNGPKGEKGALKDITNVYSFSLGAKLIGEEEKKTSEIVKVAVDDDGNYITELIELDNEKEIGALEGAKFGLYTDKDKQDETTLYTNPKTDGYFTTGKDGVITYEGLAAGTYYLKELSAPDGYVKDTKVHEVVITAEYNDPVTVTETVNGITVTYDYVTLKSYDVTVDGVSTNKYEIVNQGPVQSSTSINKESFEVENHPGVELPSTGGIGTTMFYVVGSVLVIGAAVLLISKRRMAR